jgi:hypothetical protein
MSLKIDSLRYESISLATMWEKAKSFAIYCKPLFRNMSLKQMSPQPHAGKLPQFRQRGSYALDSGDLSEDASCNHRFVEGSHGSRRTGGIFTWFCQHGICYGFYVIPHAEGRNEAFSFLFKYFAVAPAVVVYDFSCALQEYCLNREPRHFRHTAFLIDRFHWRNHKTCARSYNLSIYPDFLCLNSEICEQVNSLLKKIKSSVSMMTQVNFMRCVRFFLEMNNDKKLKRLDDAFLRAGLLSILEHADAAWGTLSRLATT